MPEIRRISERTISYSWRACEQLRHFTGCVIIRNGLRIASFGRILVVNSAPLAVPLKTHRVGSDARLICRELKRPPVGVIVRRGGCKLSCSPRHWTMVQNDERRETERERGLIIIALPKLVNIHNISEVNFIIDLQKKIIDLQIFKAIVKLSVYRRRSMIQKVFMDSKSTKILTSKPRSGYPSAGYVAVVAGRYRYRIVACLVTSSSPVPLKTRRVGQRCTLNLSIAETSSRWCGVVVRTGGASLGVVHVT
ncbi:uncharacterized protein TNCV_2371771 [Trichonephila clavipes]|nr:uncharacterized protein TNCV_2371771 [Trichonephila clavipes]